MQDKAEIQEVVPQVAVLQALQRNMLSDGILQGIGYIILGTAVSSLPSLNTPQNFVSLDFGPENNSDFNRFEIATHEVGTVRPGELTSRFDYVVELVKRAYAYVVQTNRVVAGTLRIHLSLVRMADIGIALMWVQEKKHD